MLLSKVWKKQVPVLLFVAVVFSLSFTNVTAQDGAKLYKTHCASCHKIDGRLVGPALGGVQDRWDDEANLIAWIKNSQQYLKDNPGDDYAHGLYEEYNKSIMPPMPINDEEIGAILAYIANPDEGKEDAGGGEKMVAQSDIEEDDDATTYWLLGFIILLLIIIKVLWDVKASVKGLLRDVKGEEEFAALDEQVDDEGKSFGRALKEWAGANKALVTLAGVALLVIGLSAVYSGIMSIGVYEGYAPEQPIKFSHKIHAGENEISCVYCHHSAEKGKHSNIPSAKLCMNCHKGIQEGDQYGKEEIAKIYEAVGYNPQTAEYDGPEKPIKWIRIHNLPNLSYFNHSQHVVAGEIECQECHGPVEEFGYPMHQHSSLTMGWCINCHRETDVKMNGNEYYDKLHAQLVEKYKEEGIEKFTVEQIGGLECAKCHY